MALRAIQRGEDEEVIGDIGQADPDLLAVEDVQIAVAAGRRSEVAGIRPDARLREPECRKLLALCTGDEPALLLLLGHLVHEGHRVEPDMDALDDAECGVGLLELLADHRERDVVHPATTPAGVHRRAREALLAHPGEDLAVDLALRIPLADVRVDLRLAELPNGLLHKPVLIGRPKVDHAPILGTRTGTR